VIHAYGILSLVESGLKLRSDVQLTLQGYTRVSGGSHGGGYKLTERRFAWLVKGERHCISALAFTVAGADLNRRPLSRCFFVRWIRVGE